MEESSIRPKRNLTLDCYKGLLIILVVIRHVLQYSVADEGGILTNIIWAVQMPGFMLVSGYFAARKNRGIGKTILKNCERYLLPFLTWFVLIHVLLFGEYDRNVLKGLSELFLHVDKGLWFLWVIFVLSVIAAICNKIFSGKGGMIKRSVFAVAACGVFFGALLGVALFTGNLNILGIKFVLYYAVFYCFGYLVKLTEDFWKKYWDKIKNTFFFICLAVFFAIVFNYDLYHSEDDLIGIMLRCAAGFTGNAVLLCVVAKFENILSKAKLGQLGMYTLEIYATHMLSINLFSASSNNVFWSAAGFGNFVVSLICTCIFTTVTIAVFKSVPAANYLMYGKRKK